MPFAIGPNRRNIAAWKRRLYLVMLVSAIGAVLGFLIAGLIVWV